MEDRYQKLVSEAECSWDYIDRLRMVLKQATHELEMACGERNVVTKRMIELEQEVGRLEGALKEWAAGVCISQKHSEVIQKLNVELDHMTQNYQDKSDELEGYYALGPIGHIRDLLQAEKSGQLVMLPFMPHSTMLNLSDPENLEVMKDVSLYVAWKSSSGIVFHSPYNRFLQDIEKGYIKPDSEEAEAALAGKDGEG